MSDQQQPDPSGRPESQPPNGGPQGVPPYGQQKPYAAPQQLPGGQAPYGQPPYGQAPYGQQPNGQQPPYGQAPYGQPPYGTPQPPPYAPYPDPYAKSRLAAGLLGIFLGGLGIHRFYLGYTGIGLTMLLLSVVVPIVTLGIGFFVPIGIGIWGLVEGILYLTDKTGSYSRDSQGRPLRD